MLSWLKCSKMAAGVTKNSLVTFALGIFFGFGISYVFVNYISTPSHGPGPPDRRAIESNEVEVAKQPYDHPEVNLSDSPRKALEWTDLDDAHHKGQDKEAQELYDNVRVLCWVMTQPDNLDKKAKHVKATWAKRCNKILYMSSNAEPNFPVIGLGTGEGRDKLWAKTKAAYEYIYKNHIDDADWFMKADDDTFVVVENLRYMLKDYDPTEAVYFGRRFKPFVKQGYMSGGAGYVLSKEAVKKFVEGNCKARSIMEDVEMGRCMEQVGVRAEDSRDKLGRERFHPFVPEHHLIPGRVPKGNWYWKYQFYTAHDGPECCSDFAITFHYITPNTMYVLEYMTYHLRPYGYNYPQLSGMGGVGDKKPHVEEKQEKQPEKGKGDKEKEADTKKTKEDQKEEKKPEKVLPDKQKETKPEKEEGEKEKPFKGNDKLSEKERLANEKNEIILDDDYEEEEDNEKEGEREAHDEEDIDIEENENDDEREEQGNGDGAGPRDEDYKEDEEDYDEEDDDNDEEQDDENDKEEGEKDEDYDDEDDEKDEKDYKDEEDDKDGDEEEYDNEEEEKDEKENGNNDEDYYEDDT
ncbi:glycoprotein-N-acetylgalactosamine 3-beta-galactosyltransferase 1-like isoform X1 [Branchiostoma floridae]|uniref:Glycoprotein-N-acetylgalactosamine 3-beta-galactosyltransferase 1 n=2 Tax=Branchiostoma floridae TaxID=7739 RepID=A0A9J7LVA5_BRAFL|nr:glycoprotein-N-acetylgalactosamine 3-beta-galactosyltransferase 1-like isoform X1 [Branchiostoma floridae]